MPKIKTVSTARIEEPFFASLCEFCDIKVTGWAETDNIWSDEDIFPEYEGAEILIIGYEKLTRDMMAKLPQLRLIACCRSNPVNIDCEGAKELGIPVVYTPGRNANAVAEFTIGLMLDICRNLTRANTEIKSGKYLGLPKAEQPVMANSDDIIWENDDANVYAIYKGFDLEGKTLGLVGMGLIGSLVAKKAMGLGMNVIVHDPYVAAAAEGTRLVSFEELLSEADFISLHCKNTKATHNLFNANTFKQCKKTAYLINTARAWMVEEDAVISALKSGEIAGAAIDVFWQEPLPSDHEILTLDNVIVTPHIAGSSKDVPIFQSKMITEDILSFIKGEPLMRVK